MSALFSPLTLRSIEFHNRVFVSPMCQYSSDNGMPNEWHAVHLGSILLFGGFLAWAVIARISAKRRALSPGAVVSQHGGAAAAPAGWRNDAIAVSVGLVTWFVFAKYLHPLLIGVAAWPGQA